ncbi:MAG TPA: protein kinase, partial [Thermoanaerobaculia bacterium]|nr:protein kinase [Thermoanaerobaculia bacterium]
MTLTAGDRLGPYEIVALIGEGGMGRVYRAKDTRLDRAVAIKTLATHFSDNSELKQRFEREARAISAIAHPHICTLHDVGEHEGTEYLVMEFLEGETLADRLRRGPLPIDQVLRYGIEIASALDHAHRRGIVHRDLKPGNVMITKAGAKLLDFGLAKSVAVLTSGSQSGGQTAEQGRSSEVSVPRSVGEKATELKPLTEQGTLIGTFQYMAPEQLEGVPADARTDIFAFGVLLYEMATGRKAFEGKSRASLIASILDRQPPPVSSVQPLSPLALDRVISTCLQKDPDDRWQTAHDLVLQLKWLAEGGSGVHVAPVAGRRRRPETIAWTVAAVAVALAALAGGLLLRERMTRQARPIVSSITPSKEVFLVSEEAPAISPDGLRIAFIGHVGDVYRVYVRDLAKEEPQPVAGTEGAEAVFWSPDGRQLGFFTDSHLKRVAVAGGPAQALCPVRQQRGGAWAPDGTIIFGAYREPLFKVSSSGGTPSALTKLGQGELNHRFPVILPNGTDVVFLVQRAEGRAPDDPSTIDAVSLRTGKRKQLLRANSSPLYARSGHLLFWRDNTLFAQAFDARKLEVTGEPFPAINNVGYSGNERALASMSDNGTLAYIGGGNAVKLQLVWHDRSGKEIGREGEPMLSSSHALSADGTRVAFDLDEGTS